MPSQSGMNAVVEGMMRELETELEAEFEAQDAPADQTKYYWCVAYRPGASVVGGAWQVKENSTPKLFGPVGAMNRFKDCVAYWTDQLYLAGGWLRVAQYKQVGDTYRLESCDKINLDKLNTRATSCKDESGLCG